MSLMHLFSLLGRLLGLDLVRCTSRISSLLYNILVINGFDGVPVDFEALLVRLDRPYTDLESLDLQVIKLIPEIHTVLSPLQEANRSRFEGQHLTFSTFFEVSYIVVA